ncbi:MAG: class I SAM-dependent methyltransferase [Candidatus Aminicenantales bacterium]
MSSLSKFTRAGVRDYEKRRYRGLDQRIVHAREMKIIGKMIARAEADMAMSGRLTSRPGEGRLALDLPCGYGRFTPMLRERGFDVVSADLSVEMARRAAEKAAEFPQSPPGSALGENPERGSWFPALAADAGRLPFRSCVFDLVFSIRFFHHVHAPEDRLAILREFHRATAGYVVVSFYRANGLHTLQRRLRRLFGKSRTNIKMVEPGVFEKAAAEAGFEIVRIAPLFRGLHAYHVALLKKERMP